MALAPMHGMMIDAGLKVSQEADSDGGTKVTAKEAKALVKVLMAQGASPADIDAALANKGLDPATKAVFAEVLHPKSQAQTLLADGQRALKEGRYADAKKAFAELKKLPPEQLDLVKDVDVNANIKVMYNGGNKTTIVSTGFRESSVVAADRGLAQAEMAERMSVAVAPKKFDPHNLADCKAYFQAYAKTHSADELRKELQAYLQVFYVHAGGGVDWDPKVPGKDRVGKLDTLLANQPSDASGRTIIDCEGFCFLTGAIMGSIKGADGKPRFEVHYLYGTTDDTMGHEIALVWENKKPPTPPFEVSNHETTQWKTPASELPNLSRTEWAKRMKGAAYTVSTTPDA